MNNQIIGETQNNLKSSVGNMSQYNFYFANKNILRWLFTTKQIVTTLANNVLYSSVYFCYKKYSYCIG